jgi:uncharacterized protein
MRTAELRRENEVLSELLPKPLSIDAVTEALSPLADALRAAKTEGQAIGVAMKHLKASGTAVDAATTKEAIKRVLG